MPTKADIQNAAARLVKAVPLARQRMNSGKLFEAWVMLEFGLAAKTFGWSVEWRAWDYEARRQPCKRIVFGLGSGGGLPDANSTSEAPGYLYLEKNQRAYEVNNSTRFIGASAVTHEIDLSIIEASIGTRLRRRGGGLPDVPPNVQLELKRYSSSLPVGVARADALVAIDLVLNSAPPIVMNSDIAYVPGSHSAKAFSHGKYVHGSLTSSYREIITTATTIGSSAKLAAYFSGNVISGIMSPKGISPGTHPDILALAQRVDAQL